MSFIDDMVNKMVEEQRAKATGAVVQQVAPNGVGGQGSYTAPDGQIVSGGVVSNPFGEGEPGKYGYTAGKWGLVHALSDPNSHPSKMSYYGGDRDYAANQYDEFRGRGSAFANQAGPQANWNNDSWNLQNNAAADSYRTMLGIETAAQKQLGDNYGRVAGSIAGMAQSARPGLMQASARRRAEQAIAGNQQNLSNDLGMLQAQEMQRARDQYGQALGDMRAAGANRATTEANLAEGQKNINSQMVTGMNTAADKVAGAGLSGTTGRQTFRRDVLAANMGVANRERESAARYADVANRTTLGGISGGLQGAARIIGGELGGDDDPRKKV